MRTPTPMKTDQLSLSNYCTDRAGRNVFNCQYIEEWSRIAAIINGFITALFFR